MLCISTGTNLLPQYHWEILQAPQGKSQPENEMWQTTLCWWWAGVSASSTLGTPTRSHVTGRKPSHRSAFRSATPPFTEWMTGSYGHNADNLSIAEIIATPRASVYITPLSASQLRKERRFINRLDMFIRWLCNNTWHSNGDYSQRWEGNYVCALQNVPTFYLRRFNLLYHIQTNSSKCRVLHWY